MTAPTYRKLAASPRWLTCRRCGKQFREEPDSWESGMCGPCRNQWHQKHQR